MPISSLHSNYGIGSFGKAAYEFVDYLKSANQKLWQVLPLGPTSYGDSPYQSFSAFAGNPYFIDLDILINKGLLKAEEVKILQADDGFINYQKLYQTRFKILHKAFLRFDFNNKDFIQFCKRNSFWLYNYCFFMTLKKHFGDKSWMTFNNKIKTKNQLNKYRRILKPGIMFNCFLQYEFFWQWERLKKYANQNNIKIIGDIPIYVAMDSADVFFNTSLFQFNKNLIPKGVAGCPPDAFSPTGQLWGNPLYDWNYHKKTNYKWWTKRLQHSAKLFDILRIDHFRGFESYYFIPYGSKTAENGWWEKGPDLKFFQIIKKRLNNINIIAEDLGFITPQVETLIKKTGFPSMAVLQFAFDDINPKNKYLPHNLKENCIIYTGTHDNTTTKDYFNCCSERIKNYILNYLDCKGGNVVNAFIKAAFASIAKMAVIPMNDILNLDSSARINTPSTIGGNWIWRIKKQDLNVETANYLKQLTYLYNR